MSAARDAAAISCQLLSHGAGPLSQGVARDLRSGAPSAGRRATPSSHRRCLSSSAASGGLHQHDAVRRGRRDGDAAPGCTAPSGRGDWAHQTKSAFYGPIAGALQRLGRDRERAAPGKARATVKAQCPGRSRSVGIVDLRAGRRSYARAVGIRRRLILSRRNRRGKGSRQDRRRSGAGDGRMRARSQRVRRGARARGSVTKERVAGSVEAPRTRPSAAETRDTPGRFPLTLGEGPLPPAPAMKGAPPALVGSPERTAARPLAPPRSVIACAQNGCGGPRASRRAATARAVAASPPGRLRDARP